MRPAREGRENATAQVTTADVVGPSMRPAREGRENGVAGGGVRRADDPSMRPAREGRENGGRPRHQAGMRAGLQ